MSRRSGADGMPTITSLPALIDATTRQLGEARDLGAVREIKNRAEALRERGPVRPTVALPKPANG